MNQRAVLDSFEQRLPDATGPTGVRGHTAAAEDGDTR